MSPPCGQEDFLGRQGWGKGQRRGAKTIWAVLRDLMVLILDSAFSYSFSLNLSVPTVL